MNWRAQIQKPSTLLPSATHIRNGVLQRKCACGATPAAGGECAECHKKREALLHRRAIGPEPDEVPPIVHEVLRSPGQPLDAETRAFMEPRFGHDFSRVRLHLDAKAALSSDAVNALAYTVGTHVVFGGGQYTPTETLGRQLLAHELTHVVQQRSAWETSSPTLRLDSAHSVAEQEAEAYARQIDHRRGPGAFTIAPALLQRQSRSPHDRLVVERARSRLPILRQFVDEWTVREARRLQTARDRDPLLERRRQMDRRAGAEDDVVEAVSPGLRARMEEANLVQLNRQPLLMEVTEEEIVFRVRFHARFEDPGMASRIGELSAGLNDGIAMVWNQRLQASHLNGRRFRIVPQITQIAVSTPRDRKFWLITIRPTDQAPAAYPGCALEATEPGVTTSVTDSHCDGGVMSIPPAHLRRGDVLGHELLHLFGLIDRYVSFVDHQPGHPARVQSLSLRTTGGRPDPLGAGNGTILAEDLAFLFDRLGVYDLEQRRGLEVLRRLENEGLSINAVIAEIDRLETIVRLGHDPRSLIRPRTDFTDRMIRDADNL